MIKNNMETRAEINRIRSERAEQEPRNAEVTMLVKCLWFRDCDTRSINCFAFENGHSSQIYCMKYSEDFVGL